MFTLEYLRFWRICAFFGAMKISTHIVLRVFYVLGLKLAFILVVRFLNYSIRTAPPLEKGMCTYFLQGTGLLTLLI